MVSYRHAHLTHHLDGFGPASRRSAPATTWRPAGLLPVCATADAWWSLHGLGRRARCVPRRRRLAPGSVSVRRWRLISRLIVEGGRPKRLAMARNNWPAARLREICSRSASDSRLSQAAWLRWADTAGFANELRDRRWVSSERAGDHRSSFPVFVALPDLVGVLVRQSWMSHAPPPSTVKPSLCMRWCTDSLNLPPLSAVSAESAFLRGCSRLPGV
jgi:hypothetical protein